uniref:Uncharacterized protein n=1 Tax=Anguilla anguilla TaxID=7936 RepID=A0A0E9WI50_ANGAN
MRLIGEPLSKTEINCTLTIALHHLPGRNEMLQDTRDTRLELLWNWTCNRKFEFQGVGGRLLPLYP